MDKQQELTKKVYNAINDTLGKEDVTTEEGINAMMSAVLRIVYACAGAMHIDPTWTQKNFALDVFNQVIEQIKTMPDNVYFKGK